MGMLVGAQATLPRLKTDTPTEGGADRQVCGARKFLPLRHESPSLSGKPPSSPTPSSPPLPRHINSGLPWGMSPEGTLCVVTCPREAALTLWVWMPAHEDGDQAKPFQPRELGGWSLLLTHYPSQETLTPFLTALAYPSKTLLSLQETPAQLTAPSPPAPSQKSSCPVP